VKIEIREVNINRFALLAALAKPHNFSCSASTNGAAFFLPGSVRIKRGGRS
jgi:hypothetical protein